MVGSETLTISMSAAVMKYATASSENARHWCMWADGAALPSPKSSPASTAVTSAPVRAGAQRTVAGRVPSQGPLTTSAWSLLV
jgi:hypothetical protein